MSRVCLVGTYFGRWPLWFPATWASMVANRDYDWLILTDCPVPPDVPDHIRIIASSADDVNRRASRALGFEVSKGVYAQCDLRPTFAITFADLLEGYEFWGHIDFDVIWGRISAFIDDKVLDDHWVISTRQARVSGHLSVWKRDPRMDRLFERYRIWRDLLASPDHHAFDEIAMTDVILAEGLADRVKWDRRLVVGPPELDRAPGGWVWKNGQVLRHGEEHAYLHFGAEWKRSMRHIDFGLGESPGRFRVKRRGIWRGRVPFGESSIDTCWRLRQLLKWQTAGVRRALKRGVPERHEDD